MLMLKAACLLKLCRCDPRADPPASSCAVASAARVEAIPSLLRETVRRVDYDSIWQALEDLLTLVPPNELRFVIAGARHDGFGWLIEGELSWTGANPESTASEDRPIGVSLRNSRYGPGRQ